MEVVYRDGKFGRTEHLRGVTEIYEFHGRAKNGMPAMYLCFKMFGKTEMCLRSKCEIVSIKEE